MDAILELGLLDHMNIYVQFQRFSTGWMHSSAWLFLPALCTPFHAHACLAGGWMHERTMRMRDRSRSTWIPKWTWCSSIHCTPVRLARFIAALFPHTRNTHIRTSNGYYHKLCSWLTVSGEMASRTQPWTCASMPCTLNWHHGSAGPNESLNSVQCSYQEE